MLLIAVLAMLLVLGLCLIWRFPLDKRGHGFLAVVPVFAGTWCFYLLGIQPVVSAVLAVLLSIVVGVIRLVWEADEEAC